MKGREFETSHIKEIKFKEFKNTAFYKDWKPSKGEIAYNEKYLKTFVDEYPDFLPISDYYEDHMDEAFEKEAENIKVKTKAEKIKSKEAFFFDETD